MSESTPRVTAAYLERFQNDTVRILAKVVSLRGEKATVEAGGEVTLVLNRVSACSLDPHVLCALCMTLSHKCGTQLQKFNPLKDEEAPRMSTTSVDQNSTTQSYASPSNITV